MICLLCSSCKSVQNARSLVVKIFDNFTVFTHTNPPVYAGYQQMTFDFAIFQIDDGCLQDRLGIFAAGIDRKCAPDVHMTGRFVDMPMQGSTSAGLSR